MRFRGGEFKCHVNVVFAAVPRMVFLSDPNEIGKRASLLNTAHLRESRTFGPKEVLHLVTGQARLQVLRVSLES